MTEMSPPGLRDRLYAVMTKHEVALPYEAVEDVCNQFAIWLRQQAEVNSLEVGDTMLYGRASAAVMDGLAEGIMLAAPIAQDRAVSTQDPGVSSES